MMSSWVIFLLISVSGNRLALRLNWNADETGLLAQSAGGGGFLMVDGVEGVALGWWRIFIFRNTD